MKITYEHRGFTTSRQINEDIDMWLEKNLERGGIELHIKKLMKLMVILSEKYLIENPEDVSKIAYFIDCDGYNHQIIEKYNAL
jgi:hypothetical protein